MKKYSALLAAALAAAIATGTALPAAAAARLHALIDQITADAPDATVLVGTVIVSTSSTEEATRPAFNARIPGIVQDEQAAGKHVRLVDMSALTTADLSDALHPNDNGF